MLLSGIFQRKISANRLAMVGIASGQAGSVHNSVKVLVKVLFSDSNSDVFEWNWLILGILIDIYVRYCTKQEL